MACGICGSSVEETGVRTDDSGVTWIQYICTNPDCKATKEVRK